MRNLTKKPTEHQEQVWFFQKVDKESLKIPELSLLYAIPNGGLRNKIVAMKLKMEGVTSGMPDTHFPIARLGYHSLYIEMKRLKPRGTTSKEQKVWHKALAKEGHLVYVCWGGEAAWTVLNNYIDSKLTPEGKDWKKY